jgi:hypothetical protein
MITGGSRLNVRKGAFRAWARPPEAALVHSGGEFAEEAVRRG